MIKINRDEGCNKHTSFMKILLCMKFIIIISILTTLQSFASITAQGENKLNIELNDVNLRSIFKEIKQQSGFDFIYNSDEIDDSYIVSVNMKDASIDDVLKSCIDTEKINYTLKDNIIVLSKKEESFQVAQMQNGVIITGKVTDSKGEPLPGVSVIKTGSNTGVATDSDGKYRIQVTETKGASLKFVFIGMKSKVVKIGKKAVINVSLEYQAESLENIEVTYNTGMQKIKQDHVTSATSIMMAKELQNQGISSIDQILEGKIAGLNSTRVSGEIGTRSKITIRGENSLDGNTEPLWILDGLPLTTGVPKNSSGDFAGTIMQDGVGNIMPEDIASITFLKDANAAAIYGAKAANGVIVITTKKGFRSKTQISYNSNFTYSVQPEINLDFMNSAQKLKYENNLVTDYGMIHAKNAGRGGKLRKQLYDGFINKEQYDAEIARLSNINTDWFDEIFEPSQSQTHNLSIRGGSETLSYYTSMNYTSRQGIVNPNKDSNAGILMNLQYRPIEKLIMNFSFSGNARTNKNHASRIDPFNYAVFANPYERPYDENGNYASDLTYLSNNYSEITASGYKYSNFNILKEINDTKRRTDGSDLSATLDIKYYITKGLSFQSMFRKSLSHNTSITEISPNTYTSFVGEILGNEVFEDKQLPSIYDNGELKESAGKNSAWSMRNQIDYSATLFDDHLISVLLANEITSREFNNFNYTSPIYDPEYRITGVPFFADDELKYEKLRSKIDDLFGTSDGTDRTVAFLGQLRYSYKDRYVLNYTARADAADVIGEDNKYTPLWSTGARWNLHKESFFQPIKKYINNLSFRASYGFTGNIDRTAYPFSTIIMGADKYYNEIFAKEVTYPNPSVRWAKKRSFNCGFNFSVLENRISFDANYYKNRTTDILTNLNVPYASGRTSIKANGGIVENEGAELSINLRVVKTKDFSFYLSGNIARNKNVVVKAENGIKSYMEVNNSRVSQGGIVSIIGEETGGIYGWKSAGVDPNSGMPMFYLTERAKLLYARILDKWETYDEDKQKYFLNNGIIPSLTEVPDKMAKPRNSSSNYFYDINEVYKASFQYLGRSNPKYYGGFSTRMQYKRLSLTTNWIYKVGHIVQTFDDRKNAPRNHPKGLEEFSSDFAVSGTNRETKYLYRWRDKGDITDIPAYISNTDYYATTHYSNNYQDADYLRMSTLILRYNMPSAYVKRLGMRNLSMSFTATNLFTFTKFNGLDVATGNSFAYPASKDFSFKLSLGF